MKISSMVDEKLLTKAIEIVKKMSSSGMPIDKIKENLKGINLSDTDIEEIISKAGIGGQAPPAEAQQPEAESPADLLKTEAPAQKPAEAEQQSEPEPEPEKEQQPEPVKEPQPEPKPEAGQQEKSAPSTDLSELFDKIIQLRAAVSANADLLKKILETNRSILVALSSQQSAPQKQNNVSGVPVMPEAQKKEEAGKQEENKMREMIFGQM